MRVKTTSTEYEGLFFSHFPEKRLSDVLSRLDQFLNLKDAMDCKTREKFSFVVISKSSIETIKVIEEQD